MNTSLLAYQALRPHLAEEQDKVYGAIASRKNITDRELLKHLRDNDRPEWEISSINGRRNELMDLGLVVKDEERNCQITGHKVTAWRITTMDERLKFLEEKRRKEENRKAQLKFFEEFGGAKTKESRFAYIDRG